MRNKSSKLALTATFGLALAFTFSCSLVNYGGDDKGNNMANYKTVQIGSQTWMAENLNYNYNYGIDSECYNDDSANCEKYGRLYDWKTAKKVCPAGWHLPSESDWDELISYVESNNGCSACAGKHLKAASGWNSGGNGTDTCGFSALPGGGKAWGKFYDVGDSGYWWTATELNAGSDYAIFKYMWSHESVPSSSYDKSRQFSVRCVRD